MKPVYLVAIIGLAGCAPVVWDRPDTTPQQFTMDYAHCQLVARGITPNIDHTSVFASRASNLGTSIADGIAQGIEQGENRILCMQSLGYVARHPGAPNPIHTAAQP